MFTVLCQSSGFLIPVATRYRSEPIVVEALCGPLVRRPWGLVLSPFDSLGSLWPSFGEAVAAADAYRRKRVQWSEVVTFAICDEAGRMLSAAEAIRDALDANGSHLNPVEGPGSSNNPDKVSRMRPETEKQLPPAAHQALVARGYLCAL